MSVMKKKKKMICFGAIIYYTLIPVCEFVPILSPYPGGRVVCIGITPWGIVEKSHELVGKKMDIPFHPVAQPR